MLTRKLVQNVDWKKCIYCQSRRRDTLHQAQPMEVNKTIKDAALRDYKIKCRIGENYLIVYEAHYRRSCRLKAYRELANLTGKPSSDHPLEPQKSAFYSFVGILEDGFQHGHVYSMADLLEKYLEILTYSMLVWSTLHVDHTS